MDISTRLQKTLSRNDWSIRELERALAMFDVPGKSYGSIHAYVTGKTIPRQDWISSASTILGVRSAWLASGTGEMTETGEALSKQQKTTTKALLFSAYYDKLSSRVAKAIATTPFDDLLVEVQACLEQFLARYFLEGTRGSPGFGQPRSPPLPSVTEIRKFINRHFGAAAGTRDLGDGEFAAAVLAQLSILYLRFFPQGAGSPAVEG